MKKFSRLSSVLAVFVLLISVLAACGNSDSKPADDNSATEEKKTRTYKSDFGDVEIPANPERVVVLGPTYVGYLLTLGVTPIGVTQMAIDNPYFEGKLEDATNLGEGTSAEAVLELDPDLIIAYNTDENIEVLKETAPTVQIEYGKLDFKDQLREFGKMLGKEDQAEQWITQWDEKVAQNKQKVVDAVGDKTVSLIQPYAKGIYIYGDSYARGGEIIYTEFGLKAPPKAQEEAVDNGPGYASISLEVLPEYAGDYIFTSKWAGDTAENNVSESNIWKDLPAVKNGTVFEVDSAGSFFNDPLSLDQQFDFIVEKLTNN
ncbi:iron-hydroxamate ABC transporter substrate-binding protein [Bacillaceae bacterium CLA-AA-H227]|uniref:Iron-hydroxamate ABC transporter substrate-binding protein n=1 Tax=Robertmurraya yapensis (ex Hitch et al 2024) TaxID=3133160 RepID=A0ACC6SCV9_9BACI